MRGHGVSHLLNQLLSFLGNLLLFFLASFFQSCLGDCGGIHYPRSTVDFDVFVERSKLNAKRLSKAIANFGFDPKEYSPDFFLTPDSILMIGREPWRIDIFTHIKGLEFTEAYKKRVYFEVDGVNIPFVDRGDLIRSKRASNRDRDRDDIKRLTNDRNIKP